MKINMNIIIMIHDLKRTIFANGYDLKRIHRDEIV